MNEEMGILTADQRWGKIVAKDFLTGEDFSYGNTPNGCAPNMHFIREILREIKEKIIVLLHTHPSLSILDTYGDLGVPILDKLCTMALPSKTDLAAFSHHAEHSAFEERELLHGICTYRSLGIYENTSPKLFRRPIFAGKPAYAIGDSQQSGLNIPRVRQIFLGGITEEKVNGKYMACRLAQRDLLTARQIAEFHASLEV